MVVFGGVFRVGSECLPVVATKAYHRLSMGTMSKLFVQRAFERFSRVVGGRLMMDLHGFVDFMLAWDARATVQGMSVLFPVFDLDGKGYLTEADSSHVSAGNPPAVAVVWAERRPQAAGHGGRRGGHCAAKGPQSDTGHGDTALWYARHACWHVGGRQHVLGV